MVGIGPARALATEVGGDSRAREQGRNCPSLFLFFFFCLEGEVPSRPLFKDAVLRGGSRA